MSTLIDVANEKEGGSTLIGLVTVGLGYKVMATGPQDQSLFVFDPTNKVSRETALEQARNFSKSQPTKPNPKTGKEEHPRPNKSIFFKIHKASVKSTKQDGTPASSGWKADRLLVYPTWTNVYTTIVGPATEKLGLEAGDYWMELAYAPDPDGRTKKDQNGEDRLEFHAYPITIFKTEAEAAEAAGVTDAPGPDTNYGLDADGLSALADDLIERFKNGETATFIIGPECYGQFDEDFVKRVAIQKALTVKGATVVSVSKLLKMDLPTVNRLK